MRTRPFVETVALRDVARDRAAIEASNFDPCESPSILSLRTLAGFLCVKKAAAAAAHFTDNNIACREKDVLVGHDDQGAPRIFDMHGAVKGLKGKIHVSLSHTANHACGCAVIGEGSDHA